MGFGYFGAARSYDTWTNDEIADIMDDDGDGAIDLKHEYSYGHSVNAAKRDEGCRRDGHDRGRLRRLPRRSQPLCDTLAELTSAQRDELGHYRDIAVTAREEAIVHGHPLHQRHAAGHGDGYCRLQPVAPTPSTGRR